MADFIVDNTKISQSQYEAELDVYLAGTPDSGIWNKFFISSTGQVIKKAVASLGAFLGFKTVVGRRETYLQFVQQISSAHGISETLGYSAFRGQNTTLDLTTTPNFTGNLVRYQIIGSVKDLDIILLEDTPVVSGTNVVLKVAIGSKKSEVLNVTSDNLARFRFVSPNVSEEFRVLLNTTEVTVSKRILDLANDLFSALTNPFTAIDLFYLNRDSAPIQYNAGDTLTLEFLELNDLSFIADDISFDFGEFVAFLATSPFLASEVIEEIQINAPVFHETQQLVKGRLDYAKLFKGLDTALADTNQRDVSAAVVELVYVKKDNTLFTSSEKQGLIDSLDITRPFGVQPPEMTDPTRVPVNLLFTVSLLDNSGDPITTIATILDDFENKLGQTLDFEVLENLVEVNSFIRTARLEISPSEWLAATGYQIGSFVKSTGTESEVFQVSRKIYSSASTEPVWPTSSGVEIVDNDIVWLSSLTDFSKFPNTWITSTEYFNADYVLPTVPNGFMFKAVRTINKSFSNTEIQKIEFDSIPDSGTWRISFNGEQTTDLTFNASAASVQIALNNLNSLSTVVVTGDYLSGFTVDFVGDDADKEQPQLTVDNPGTDEIQLVSFSDIPNNGDWQLSFDGQTTTSIAFNATSADVKTALELLPNVDTVDVVGDFSNGFAVTFKGLNSLQDVSLLVQSSFSDPGTDEIQTISFDVVPTSGTWRIHLGTEFTNDIPFNASNTTIQAELNSLDSLSSVVVTGSYAADITVTFQGSDGKKNQLELDTSDLGRNEIQTILFSNLPDSGTWRLKSDTEQTTDLLSNASASSIKSALEALPSITDVTVTGDYSSGIVVEYTGVDGIKPHPLVTVSDLGDTEISTITTTGISGAGLNAKTFLLSDSNGSVAFWFDVDNSGTPTPAAALDADRNVEVSTILTSDPDSIVANKLAVAVNADTQFLASFLLNVITVTASTPGTRDNLTDVDTGFAFGVTTEGTVPASNLTRLGQLVVVTPQQTTLGLIVADSINAQITHSTITAGEAPVSNLDKSAVPVDITIVETTKGALPGSNLVLVATPVVVTTSTLVDAVGAEPVWPTEVGLTVNDGEIIWVALEINGTPATWQPGTNYDKADFVVPTVPVLNVAGNTLMFQTLGFLGTSSSSEPAWPSLGNTVIENDIVWLAVDPKSTPPTLDFEQYYKTTSSVLVTS